MLGQLASELAGVTVEEGTLCPPAWPDGWPASRRDATGRRPEPSYNPLLLPEERGGGG